MWTRSRVSESRYRRGRTRGRLRYGVIGRSREQQVEKGEKADRSRQVYGRSVLGCRRGATRRRTKLEGRGENGRTRRREGKRYVNYTTETVKLVRRRARGVWRRSTGFAGEEGVQAKSGEGEKVGYEYPVLVRLGTIGLRRMVNANDRMGRYLGIEWLSLTLYVMAGFRRGSAYSTEAGLKYYVVGSFGSAWILLGMSMVYGWTGSVNRTEIERRRRGNRGEGRRSERRLTRVGWELMRGARLLKLAGVPRHRWLADVYEGAPRDSVMYFTVVPKRGLFYVRSRRVRIWYVQEDGDHGRSQGVTQRRIAVSVRSMRVGSIGALRQRRRKRFRAYSAIGHTGYILLGVRTGTREGIQGVRVYTRIYMVMTRVMWQRRSVGKVRKGDEDQTQVKVRGRKYRTDRGELGKENPGRAARTARTCMSMAGVPPMAGFAAKRGVFMPRVGSSYGRRARIGVRASVIGGFNYLRVTKRRFFDDRNAPSTKPSTKRRETQRSQPRARRRGREGRRRTGRRRVPSWFLILTHRLSVERRV